MSKRSLILVSTGSSSQPSTLYCSDFFDSSYQISNIFEWLSHCCRVNYFYENGLNIVPFFHQIFLHLRYTIFCLCKGKFFCKSSFFAFCFCILGSINSTTVKKWYLVTSSGFRLWSHDHGSWCEPAPHAHRTPAMARGLFWIANYEILGILKKSDLQKLK